MMGETVVFVIIGGVCGMILGFWLGRMSIVYSGGQTDESSDDMTGETAKEEKREEGIGSKARRAEQGRLWYEKRMTDGTGIYSIGSPVTGVVTDCREGKHPEVILYPTEEKVYAPAGGKVLRMLPLGNEILFRTEEGTVLRMWVGEGVDELQSEYFRPKAIQNEVVNKGKLLLEFDKKALEAEGIECTLAVRVEEPGIGDKVLKIADGRVKSGESIFEIYRM